MTQIPVEPIILKDVVLTLGTDTYEKHVSQVEFTPAASIVNWKGLSPASVFAFPTAAVWSCTLAYAQDWKTTDSLSRYLYDNEGEQVAASFKPVSGSGGTWSADLLIIPGAIGGTVDQVAVATVTLGVLGRPEFTPPA